MSLYDSWQQQREQRQQAVYQLLSSTKQERQIQAAQLRDDLSLFYEALKQKDALRKLDFQRLQIQMQQFKAQLEADTRMFLQAASDRRQTESQQLAQALAAFVQTLQQQTAEFVTTVSAERIAMAQKLSAELDAFHQSLSADASLLRQDLQTQVATLKTETQTLLTDARIQRLQQARDLRQNLARNRADRLLEVQAMFSHLADFRAELRQSHLNLRQTVWGNSPAAAPKLQPVKATAKPQPSTKPPATKANAKAAATPKNISRSVPSVGAFQNGNSLAVVPVQAAKAPQKDLMAYEKEIYNHIHKMNGARLTEIESSLGVNRFQAVDALRSLIKKGMITQRDRIYLVQEDLAHK